jgi:HAD superfamily hydrolase (TIGR01509 family)
MRNINLTTIRNKKAIIFDMDGTLVDNIPFHRDAWILFLKNQGINLAPDDFIRQDHGNIYEMIRHFFGRNLPDEKVKELGQEREETYRSSYQGKVKAIEGLESLLNKMSEVNVKASLATMSDTPSIDLVIDELNIRNFFHSITGGLEIRKGKPDPEIYELAVKKLGLKNTDCLVIEDSLGGIISARRAGIEVIGITTSHKKKELFEHGCISTISNFYDLILYLN